MMRFIQGMLPVQGSTLAPEIDSLFYFILAVSVVFFALIAALIARFVYKYQRRGPNDKTAYITHHLGLELAWSLIPLAIVMVIFFWGFHGYMAASVSPGEALEIQVTAKKWLWQFEYPNGTRAINEFHVPVNRPVKLVMMSEDVLHSFFVPSFRVKMDVIPNRYTELWFNATLEGHHALFCTEYCGKGHSDMLGRVVVDSDAKFTEWLETGGDEGKNMPLKDYGARLYESRGCSTCHSLDGTRGQGPTWKNLFATERKMSDGKVVKADENYLRSAILTPQAEIVAGFEGIMPTFQGLLRDREIAALIEFIKSQSPNYVPPAEAKPDAAKPDPAKPGAAAGPTAGAASPAQGGTGQAPSPAAPKPAPQR